MTHKELHVLSLGAGVQSTTVYLLAIGGELHLDCAIFADTGDEPKAVYEHLKWLQSLNGPRIHITSKGRLSDDLLRGENSGSLLYGKRQRFAAVPFFTRKPDGEVGMTRRQCSAEYKVEPVERCIRRVVIGLKPRQRVPKDIKVHQYFGISLDEARRTIGIKKRVERPHFPLIEMDSPHGTRTGWTRTDCINWLQSKWGVEVPRSACVYCPFHSDAEWKSIRQRPDDWALAVKVDAGLRMPGAIVNRNMEGEMFAHRSCVPLDQVEFKHERQFNMFTQECEGMCGV